MHCPLGKRIQDICAWNAMHGENVSKHRHSWEEWRDLLNAKSHQEKIYNWNGVSYQVLAYILGKCPVKKFTEAVDWAMRQVGLDYTSSKTLAELRAHVRKFLEEQGVDYESKRLSSQAHPKFLLIANWAINHYKKHGNRKLEDVIAYTIKQKGYKFSEEEMKQLLEFVKYLLKRLGIDWEVLSGVKLQKSLPLCIRPENKELSSKTAGRGKSKYAPNLVKAVFAILRGRKKLFGFGRYWPQNNEGWVTCQSLHYDNCKVLFSEKVLFRPVYELIQLGAKAKDIVCEYGILLHKHHGLAVDNESSAWQPTGLAKELKANVCRKYLGL